MTVHCSDTKHICASVCAVRAQSTLACSQVLQSSMVISKAQGRQAGVTQKRTRCDQDHCEGSVPAVKSKKVRFTEPPKDTGSVHHPLRSDPEPQQPPTVSHPRSSSTAPAASHSRSCRKEPPASAPDQERQCSPGNAQDSAAGEGFQTVHKPAIAARTRAAVRAQSTAHRQEPTIPASDQCLDIDKKLNAASRSIGAAKGATKTSTNNGTRLNKKQPTARAAHQAGDRAGAHAPKPTEKSHTASQEPVAARTRTASRAAVVTIDRRSKRKEPSIAASDEQRCPATKRARAGKVGADVTTTGSTAPCPGTGTGTALTKKRRGRPVKSTQQSARAIKGSGFAKERSAGLNKMH